MTHATEKQAKQVPAHVRHWQSRSFHRCSLLRTPLLWYSYPCTFNWDQDISSVHARSEYYVDLQASKATTRKGPEKRTRKKCAPQIWGPGAVQWILVLVGVRHCGLELQGGFRGVMRRIQAQGRKTGEGLKKKSMNAVLSEEAFSIAIVFILFLLCWRCLNASASS